MPKKKQADDAPPPKKVRTDRQGHADGTIEYVPTADEYDPARHANHSHLNP